MLHTQHWQHRSNIVSIVIASSESERSVAWFEISLGAAPVSSWLLLSIESSLHVSSYRFVRFSVHHSSFSLPTPVALFPLPSLGAQLPNWASARDVFDVIKPALEIERSARSFAIAKEKHVEEERLKAAGGGDGARRAPPRGAAAKAAAPAPIPYTLQDVQKVF